MNTRLAQQRAAQGFPPTVADAAVLAKIAAVVLGDGEGAAGATPHTNIVTTLAGATRPAPTDRSEAHGIEPA